MGLVTVSMPGVLALDELALEFALELLPELVGAALPDAAAAALLLGTALAGGV